MGLGGDQGGAASPGNDANLDSAEPAPCGRLNILFLIAGTRGDVQPAATLAAYLQARFGHVVRFATHTVHRQLVAARPYSLDFFPLAGDPQALTELAIRHRCVPERGT